MVSLASDMVDVLTVGQLLSALNGGVGATIPATTALPPAFMSVAC